MCYNVYSVRKLPANLSVAHYTSFKALRIYNSLQVVLEITLYSSGTDNFDYLKSNPIKPTAVTSSRYIRCKIVIYRLHAVVNIIILNAD